MENFQKEETMHVTGKQLQNAFLMIIATLLGYVVVQYFIIPQITFLQFLGTELVIMALYSLTQYISKRK